MTFILISGKSDVGKTTVCNKLHGMLSMNKAFKFYERKPIEIACREDFIAHYEKNGKHIVINSPSDGDSCMLEFAKYLDDFAQKKVRPEIIITTIREEDEVNKNEYPMSRMLALLQAIADGKKNLEDYYNQNIAGKSPADLAPMPTSIKRPAFVLHLEKQPLDGIENKREETLALVSYMDDNADKIKYAIDFALARL